MAKKIYPNDPWISLVLLLKASAINAVKKMPDAVINSMNYVEVDYYYQPLFL